MHVSKVRFIITPDHTSTKGGMGDMKAGTSGASAGDRIGWLGWLYHRFIMGDSSWGILPEEVLRAKIGWDNDDTEANERRIRTIKYELAVTGDILNQQFNKVGVLIALLGFIIAIGLTRQDGESRIALAVVCLAAIFAIWAQSPRFKVIFRFRGRQDAGLRAGAVSTQWQEYYYVYKWLVSREHTTNAIEMLVMLASFFTIVALCFVAFA